MDLVSVPSDQNMSQGAKCFNTPHLYTNDPHFYNLSINIGSISFFSSSDMHQAHHLYGCHAAGINSSLIFFKCFAFFKFSMLDKKAVLTRGKIKTICLTKKTVQTREKSKTIYISWLFHKLIYIAAYIYIFYGGKRCLSHSTNKQYSSTPR